MLVRTALLAVALVGCAVEEPVPGPAVDLFEQVWAETIRPHDVIVAVPGTGGHSGLGVHIEAAAKAGEIFDARDHVKAIEVLEGAIAAAQRAGMRDAEIESGTVELAIWGAGIDAPEFRYRSLDGLVVRFSVVGGTSVCGDGDIPDNLINYNGGNAAKDANDLYQRVGAWLAGAPALGHARNVTLVSHSWGGAVAEYTALHHGELVAAHGAWTGGVLAYTVAAGVPAFVPGFQRLGPGFRTVSDTVRTYEVDRPDDPVHTFDPNAQGGGHHYVILFGDEYRGWYGITTDELACDGVPGPCERRE